MISIHRGRRLRFRRRPTQWHPTQKSVTADNVIPYADQALLLALRSAGEEAVMQGIWIYEKPVDMDALRRFHQAFGQGLVGRRIECSPLPFGRHRWVCVPGPQIDIDIAEGIRPRDELFDWADEHAQYPLDPQWGPGWRMGIAHFTDSTTAISIVVSHCVIDGAGLALTFLETMGGVHRDLGYPPPLSRTRARALLEDLRQTGRDMPEVGRTIVKAITSAITRRKELISSKSSAPLPGSCDDSQVVVPAVTFYVDIDDWDARAESLGGNPYSLLAGVAAKLAELTGRVCAADGVVNLLIPVNERLNRDHHGGNVVSIAKVSIDPHEVTQDLCTARTAIRNGISSAKETSDDMVALLPLIPFVPKRALRRVVDMAFGFSADAPVSCTNLGDLPAEITHIDGTPAQYVSLRGIDRYVTRHSLERRGGLLTIASARIAGKVVVTVISYQPGRQNTIPLLRETITQTLNDFDLRGVIAR